MLTGEIRSQVDQIWNAFWSGGVSNPLSVIEQITFLLFIKRLDDLHTLEENKAEMLGQPMGRRIFPEGENAQGVPYEHMRWSRFKHFEASEMMTIVADQVFPFLRTLGDRDDQGNLKEPKQDADKTEEEKSASDNTATQKTATSGNPAGGNPTSGYGVHMKDARLGFNKADLLVKTVDMLDKIPMDDRDTKGDLYEYMLGKIASAGTNGQFRTPRHIIQLMVQLTAPTPDDVICDPAAGTCGFLVNAGEYLRQNHKALFHNQEQKKHFHNDMFYGFDFDPTMLRIGAMNMILHGVEQANVIDRDSLAETQAHDNGQYSLILANPPFAGSLDYEATAKDLQKVVKTKKTELLFMALFLRLLQVGGRAAVIVPDGVLFGSSKAHKTLRKMIVEDHKLEAIIKLPSGVFKPYAGVSTAIVMFTKTGVGGTENVWFYDVQADGYSLDDKRTPLLDEGKLGVSPTSSLGKEDHEKNNLPDIAARWLQRESSEKDRKRTAQSFCVPKTEIAASGSYDLSLNRYKEVVYEEVVYDPPKDIIADLRQIETEIAQGLKKLEGML